MRLADGQRKGVWLADGWRADGQPGGMVGDGGRLGKQKRHITPHLSFGMSEISASRLDLNFVKKTVRPAATRPAAGAVASRPLATTAAARRPPALLAACWPPITAGRSCRPPGKLRPMAIEASFD